MDTPRDALLGRLAIRKGLISIEQLEACLREQDEHLRREQNPPTLGALLVQRGYLAGAALHDLLQDQAAALTEPLAGTEVRRADGLFGKRILGHRLATPQQLNEALRVQGRLHDQGISLRLGEILVSRGVLTELQIRDVLTLQEKSVLTCPRCLKAFNVRGHTSGTATACPRCRHPELAPAPPTTIQVDGTVYGIQLIPSAPSRPSPPAPGPTAAARLPVPVPAPAGAATIEERPAALVPTLRRPQ
ncbi:MAG: hypothetical protein HZA54_19775, partial [Planctomycetes bacterium]|nr:hypothetical protein [Planctomycetota bacterium]